MVSVAIYIINYNNESRREKMRNRFIELNVDVTFIKPCGPSDKRLNLLESDDKHSAPCMFSHLDCIEEFLNTDSDYCIICEDDIHIRKTFKKDLNIIIEDFEKLELDILLLGYLLDFNPRGSTNYHIKNKYTYHDYGYSLWGTQMYLINKSYAEWVYKRYREGPKDEVPFASDWTITKNGNKALIYPMLGVEEGNNNSDHYWQKKYHNDCHRFNYDPKLYL